MRRRECSPISSASARRKSAAPSAYLQESASPLGLHHGVPLGAGPRSASLQHPSQPVVEATGNAASTGRIVTSTRAPTSASSFSRLSPCSDTLDVGLQLVDLLCLVTACGCARSRRRLPDCGSASQSERRGRFPPRSRHPVSTKTLCAGCIRRRWRSLRSGAAIQHAKTRLVATGSSVSYRHLFGAI